ncbi:MAG: GDP-L-fucose synthase [Actinomycetia bacterium]|nr:GDP-L-fucose synthase [Actinomycetes bacterium]
MEHDARIYIAGHSGLVGSALERALRKAGYENLILATHAELDLCDQAATRAFFRETQPAYVFLAAATVGGIGANSSAPARFIADNLAIALNVIEAARESGVNKLLNLGSSCIYPRLAPQPIKEEALLTGPLEPTNEAYAVAKIAAIELCMASNQQYGTDFLSLMPTNLYGLGDTYDREGAHVIPAMIAKFDDARRAGAPEVELWGDGSPLREFLWADDLADAALFLMERFTARQIGAWINVGSGQEVSIKTLAEMVRAVVFTGVEPDKLPRIIWDPTKPNGTPRKLLDSSRIQALGWSASTPLNEGLRRACEDYRAKRIDVYA